MANARWNRLWFSLLSISLGLAAVRAAQAQEAPGCRTIEMDSTDGPLASPENHTVVFENADVRVLDVHSKPHTREAVHTHTRPAVMYVEQQGAGTYKTPDGSGDKSHPTDPNFKPRTFAIKPEGPHWTENTGEVPFHAIRVEFKHPGCALPGWKPAAPGPEDALVAAPTNHRLLFENDEVRVLDVHLPPHSRENFHTHAWPGVFYIVQAALLRDYPGSNVGPAGSNGAGGEPPARKFPPGREIWVAEPEAHAVENVDDTPLHLIRFELKYGSASTGKP